MTIRSLDDLAGPARAAADGLIDAAAAAVPSPLRVSLREDLTAHLCEHLDATATVRDVQGLAADLEPDSDGTRPAWAEQLLAGFRSRGLLGRIASTWWSPADNRLLLPRAVGWGWDVNLGAVAVRLGLIEADAEAVPFSSTGPAAFRAAAALPVALAGATVLHYVVRGRTLPAQLPSHWGLSGRPDRWTSRRRAAVTDLAGAGAAAGLAAWAATSDRPGPTRAGGLAAAALMASLGAGTAGLRSLGERPNPAASPLMVLSSLAAVGAVLVALARAGRDAEIASDLSEPDDLTDADDLTDEDRNVHSPE